MAKKSARSKGYRKTAAKKPYLTKRDIIILCVLLAVLAVGAILLFSYDDGALKVKDGAIVDAAENWVIVNGAARGGTRYYKLAETGEVEGFKREIEPNTADANINSIRYVPEDEASPVTAITVSATPAKAQRAADYYRSVAVSLDPTETATTEIDGRTVYYFTYQTSYHVDEEAGDAGEAAARAEGEAEAQPEAEPQSDAETQPEAETQSDAEAQTEAEPNRFEQAVHAYVDAPHDCSVSVGVTAIAETEDALLSQDALMDLVTRTLQATTVEEK